MDGFLSFTTGLVLSTLDPELGDSELPLCSTQNLDGISEGLPRMLRSFRASTIFSIWFVDASYSNRFLIFTFQTSLEICESPFSCCKYSKHFESPQDFLQPSVKILRDKTRHWIARSSVVYPEVFLPLAKFALRQTFPVDLSFGFLIKKEHIAGQSSKALPPFRIDQ
eukprot:Gb_00685 [translate_table: standard]